MGNHHGHHQQKSGESTPVSNGSRKSIPKEEPTSDVPQEEKSEESVPSQLVPVEKLAKSLLFSKQPGVSQKLYQYLHSFSASKTAYISTAAFKIQCERYLGILDDDTVRDVFVKMFAEHTDDADSDMGMITPKGLGDLLMGSYRISMDHYAEGAQMCVSSNKTIKAVVDGCFHSKTQLSAQYVSHWLQNNCPRILLPLHRYVVHILATSWRTLEDHGPTNVAGLELATPVLEQPPPFGKPHPYLLQMSMSWVLAGALPVVYSRPQKAVSPSSSGACISSASFLSKMLSVVPSHWLPLYDSDSQGLGTNRFLHHVLSYRGPTLCLLKSEGGHVFCIASPNEWRESHLYWGDAESTVIQLLPKFLILDKGEKILYLNTTIRGYPKGLRAGKDPRKPIIVVDGGFEKMEFSKIPYALDRIEVWGCGDPVSREHQLEVKKWEVKEAERQGCVKMSAADWLDHPDRYLLELAGRPQYHQNQT